MSQEVHVAIERGEGKDLRGVGNEGEGLGVEGVEGGRGV